jgi:pimeloyl-ACP methyl ester carboxylesterase
VSRTWSLGNNYTFQNEGELPDVLKNKQVLIFVHGHRTRFLKATAALSHLSLRAPSATIVGYIWPAHSRKESYALARTKASTEAADRLQALLIALQRLGNSIHIISHSMGARLTLHALSLTRPIDSENEEGPQSLPLRPIQSFFMLGAAVPSNAFLASQTTSPSNSWNYRSLLAHQIVNCYSSQDEVLSSAFQWAEAFAQYSILALFDKETRAMGSVGIVKDSLLESDLSRRLHDLDVSQEVPTHSVHAYLASGTFISYLNRVLSESEADTDNGKEDQKQQTTER